MRATFPFCLRGYSCFISCSVSLFLVERSLFQTHAFLFHRAPSSPQAGIRQARHGEQRTPIHPLLHRSTPDRRFPKGSYPRDSEALASTFDQPSSSFDRPQSPFDRPISDEDPCLFLDATVQSLSPVPPTGPAMEDSHSSSSGRPLFYGEITTTSTTPSTTSPMTDRPQMG